MNTLKNGLRSTALAFAALAVMQVAQAASPVFATDGVAIRGYDPVAYFLDGKPTKGSAQFVTEYEGAKWQFASQDHLDKFKADPEKYAPQYGGYCAYGTSLGHLAPTEPDAWTVVGGRLYLNYDKNVRTRWSKDISGNVERANAQYDALVAAPTGAE